MQNNINWLSYSGIWLLLFAIMPLIYNIDWLFYSGVGLIFFLMLADVFHSVKKQRQKELKSLKQIFTFRITDLWDYLWDIFDSIIGLIICYSLGLKKLSLFWWMILALVFINLIVFIWAKRVVAKNSNTDS